MIKKIAIVVLCIVNLINSMEQKPLSKDTATVLKEICAVDGQTFSACSAPDLSMRIKRCIELGTPIDGATLEGTVVFVPLLSAVQCKDPALTEWLLARGASCTVSNSLYKSPLHALFGLEQSKLNSEQTLHTIMQYYQTTLPYTQETIIMMQLAGNKPLIYAAKNNNETLARRCLEYGLDPNTCDERGRTALMCAVENKAYKVIRALLEYGVDATKTDNDARTALDYAKKGFDASLKQTLATFPAFNNTKIPLHYTQATPEDEKNAEELIQMNAQKLNNSPALSPVPVVTLQKPKRPTRKETTKRRTYHEEEDDGKQHADTLPEITEATGFQRPDLLSQKKPRSKKKTA